MVIRRPGALFPVFFLLVFNLAGAQSFQAGPQSAGVGGCYATRSGATAIAGNQAGLGWDGERLVMAECSMPFLVRELGIAGISLSLPLYHGHIAGKFISAAIPGYHDHSLWLSYGLRIHQHISAGAGLCSNLIGIRDRLIHHYRVSFAGGLQVKTGERLIMAGHILYPLQYSSSERSEVRLAGQIALGCSYEFFENNLLHAECRVDGNGHPLFIAGIESAPGELVTLSAGISSNPLGFSFGTGFRLTHCAVVLAFRQVMKYGLTSSIGLEYEF